MAGWIEALGQNLRYAARGLSKRPGFTLVAVLTLAIGISGTTTIFTAIDALLLRPLPYPDHDRLVALYNRFPEFAHGDPHSLPPTWHSSETDVGHPFKCLGDLSV